MITRTTSLTVDVTAKKGRFTELTDYAALGFDLNAAQAKILGTVFAQGEMLVQKISVGSPLIDLQSGATYFEFDLVLDSLGEVAQITYSIESSLRMAPAGLQFLSSGTVTTLIGDGNAEYAQFLQTGDDLIFAGTPNATRTIETVDDLVSGNPSYTLTAEIDLDTPYDSYGFDLTSYPNMVIGTYKGCTQLAAATDLTSDCSYGNNGTWSVTNETPITTQTLVSLSATINYPSWTGEVPIVVTSLPYTNNRLATGAYSVVLTEVISQVESDGLIIQYTATSKQEFNVRCAQPLCSLNKCIENLRAANAAALASNAISPYQANVDNIALLWIEAQNYLACGDTANYQTTVEAIQAELDSSGCDCGCCQDDNLMWVYNTSQSAQDAIEQLQTEVLALQNPTIYNKVFFDSVFPVKGDTGVLPNDPIYFRPFTDISEITIPKEYLAVASGYPKAFIQVEFGVYTESNSYLVNVVNKATDTNIAPAMTVSAVEGETKLTLKLYAYEFGTSAINQIVTCEGDTIDNGTTPNTCTYVAMEENSGTTLWDTEADLVLDFTPTDEASMGFTYFRITAIAIP